MQLEETKATRWEEHKVPSESRKRGVWKTPPQAPPWQRKCILPGHFSAGSSGRSQLTSSRLLHRSNTRLPAGGRDPSHTVRVCRGTSCGTGTRRKTSADYHLLGPWKQSKLPDPQAGSCLGAGRNPNNHPPKGGVPERSRSSCIGWGWRTP